MVMAAAAAAAAIVLVVAASSSSSSSSSAIDIIVSCIVFKRSVTRALFEFLLVGDIVTMQLPPINLTDKLT